MDAALDTHYLGAEPVLESSYNFLRVIAQPSGMSVGDREALVMSEFSKCMYPPEAADRLQRVIFLFGISFHRVFFLKLTTNLSKLHSSCIHSVYFTGAGIKRGLVS